MKIIVSPTSFVSDPRRSLPAILFVVSSTHSDSFTLCFSLYFWSLTGSSDAAEGSVITSSNGQHSVELQFARCMSNRYRNVEFPRCVSCTRRWAGDTCRFQNIRRFVKENQVIVGVAFHNAEAGDFPEMQYPKSWNTALKLEHVDRTKVSAPASHLPLLRHLFQHLRPSENHREGSSSYHASRAGAVGSARRYQACTGN